jgi:hypothetical protein
MIFGLPTFLPFSSSTLNCNEHVIVGALERHIAHLLVRLLLLSSPPLSCALEHDSRALEWMQMRYPFGLDECATYRRLLHTSNDDTGYGWEKGYTRRDGMAGGIEALAQVDKVGLEELCGREGHTVCINQALVCESYMSNQIFIYRMLLPISLRA